jgi:hypothetical protein
VDVSPSSGGAVKVEQAIPSSYPGTFTFRNDALVRLEAVPAAGYNFNNWSGDLNSTANPITILVDCNKKITANFSQGTSSWWLIGIIIAAAIIGMMVWLIIRSRKAQ